MWNGKLVSSLVGSMAVLAIVQSASVARAQDYSIAQFISVLNGLGYAVPLNAPPSDPKVQQAIREFQVDYRLPVDGTLNRPTQDRAMRVVKTLQTQLNRIVKPSPQLPISQFYGQQTETAVRLFQQQNKLPATGVATIETRQRLEDLFNDAVPRGSTSSSTPPSSNTTASESSSSSTRTPSTSNGASSVPFGKIYTGQQVRAILIGFGYDINPEASLSDPAVVRSIRELQQLYGLSETGKADQPTQEVLSKVIRNLRNNLRSILDSDLPVASVYDSATRTAVRQFQSRFNLRVNGVANLEVRTRIDQEAKQVRKG
jgi:peptidoglycan hydrolase-like protein with peptidoglycan-binding domain